MMSCECTFPIIAGARLTVGLAAVIIASATGADTGGWTIRKGDNFAWASGSAAWGIDPSAISSVIWHLEDLPEGRYELYVGGYRIGRVVNISLGDGPLIAAFACKDESSPSRISDGVECCVGPVDLGEGGPEVRVVHLPTTGVAYLDYFRLVPRGGGDPIIVQAETITPQPAPMPVTKARVPSEGVVRSAVENIHELLWDRFVDPNTHLLYTQIPPGGVSEDRKGSVEDSSLCGGMYLDAMVLRHGATGEPDDADKACRIFQGLLANTRVSGEPGYILRGFWPNADDWLGDPSVDQYTGLLFGMWRYYRSRIPTDPERRALRELFTQVLDRLRRHQWQIRGPGGEITTFGHLDAVRPTRAERLLSLLLMGYDVTGRQEWLDEYEKLLPGRLKACTGFPNNTLSCVALQSQLSLRALLDLEPDWSRRQVYRRGMRECAQIAWRQVPEGVPTFADAESLSEALTSRDTAYSLLRVPLDGISTILLSDNLPLAKQAADRLRTLATFYDFSHCLDSRAIAPVEWNYWLAIETTALSTQ